MSLRARPLRFWAQAAVTLAVCAFLVVPVGLSILAGITENFFLGLKSGLTLRWIGEVWSLYSGTVAMSIGVALGCLAITLAIGIPAAYALARVQNRWTRAFEELLVLPVAVPGLATALALILLYGGWRDFRASPMFILVGHVLFTLPFMVRSVLAVMLAVDLRTLEEAAASLGAGFARRFLSVVLPNAAPGILAGSPMGASLPRAGFTPPWMLTTPLTRTLPVGLADSCASMRLEIGSAYTLIFFVIIIPLLVAMQWASQRAQSRRA